MAATLLSINVSMGRTFTYRGKEVKTGIYKEPVSGAVMLRQLNLEGDQQADLKVHGGVDKAVYFYPTEHYPYWQQTLARSDNDMPYGLFGENFSTQGLSMNRIRRFIARLNAA